MYFSVQLVLLSLGKYMTETTDKGDSPDAKQFTNNNSQSKISELNGLLC